jgi:hypothetical protein
MRDDILKKAQIHMMETIAVLFIFFIIVFIGIIFITKWAWQDMEVTRGEYEDLEKTKIDQKASSLPELDCSENEDQSYNCIDLLKLTPASKVISDNPEDYFDIFGFTNITVEKIYPEPVMGEKYVWNVYYNEPDNVHNIKTTKFPILIYDQKNSLYYFGVMTVRVFFT